MNEEKESKDDVFECFRGGCENIIQIYIYI